MKNIKITLGFLAILLLLLPAAFADDRIITVAKSGGDFTNPIAAMNSINDASYTKQYKIQIGPGTYDLGLRQLRIKPYVSVEGAGRGLTRIEGAVLGKYKGLIRIEKSSTLSSLSVSNFAGVYSNTTGIYIANLTDSKGDIYKYNIDFASVYIRDVSVSGANRGMISLRNGIHLDNVGIGGAVAYQAYKSYIIMQGGGLASYIPDRNIIGGTNLVLNQSTVMLKNMRFRGHGYDSGPTHIRIIEDSTVTIKYSEIEFSWDTELSTVGSGSSIKIFNSEFNGDISTSPPGSPLVRPNDKVTCLNSFDSNAMTELTSECLPSP